jgi:hypothetical protein
MNRAVSADQTARTMTVTGYCRTMPEESTTFLLERVRAPRITPRWSIGSGQEPMANG